MSDKCDVNGCENDTYAVGELRGEDDEIIMKHTFCRKHIGGPFFGGKQE